MQLHRYELGDVAIGRAWTRAEIHAAVAESLEHFADRLPAEVGARIVIKPNLNNDLVALTGNCTDLRVLGALCRCLRDRGYTDITLADGSNVGVERRRIDSFKRLRVDRLADWLGVRTVDLNRDAGDAVPLKAGAQPRIARTVREADFLISVPKIKTHAEAGLSCAMKNWVGIARGQDKRHMHYDLGRNICAINGVVKPDLVLVDGVVGMEGNGPGDGEPFRFGHILASDSAVLCDLVVARLVDLPWAQVPYLRHAFEADWFDLGLVSAIQRDIDMVRPIKRAPQRAILAEVSERRELMWLKRMVRPFVERPAVAEAAYALGIIQDVYSRRDDDVGGIVRTPDACGECRKCADFCPTGLSVEEIGVRTDPEDCIGCLYCWWVCPNDAIHLRGELHAMQRQVDRYKDLIERL